MNLQQFTQASNKIGKGKWTKATWKSEKTINGDHYEKVSKGVVRFVKYRNINGVTPKHESDNTNYLIEDRLFVANNGNLLVRFAKTPIKAKCTYYINGAEVDKQTYETMVKPNNNNSPIFNVHLENVISLG